MASTDLGTDTLVIMGLNVLNVPFLYLMLPKPKVDRLESRHMCEIKAMPATTQSPGHISLNFTPTWLTWWSIQGEQNLLDPLVILITQQIRYSYGSSSLAE